MTLMRSHSTSSALMDRRFSTGNVIVLLRHLPRPLTGNDSAQRCPPTPRHRRPLTRSHQRHLESAPVHINPDHHAVLKSP
jgi:hypothetical protein